MLPLRVGKADWEATGTDEAGHSVHIAALNATAAEAAQRAILRARAKYGPSAKLPLWRFLVRQRGTAGPVLHFRADAEGRAVQLAD